MSNKSEKKEDNKNYIEDYKLDSSIDYYKLDVCYIKGKFIDPESSL